MAGQLIVEVKGNRMDMVLLKALSQIDLDLANKDNSQFSEDLGYIVHLTYHGTSKWTSGDIIHCPK